MKKTLEISGIEGTKQAAIDILKTYHQERKFAFYGDLGAGKTTLIQAICEKLGSQNNVSSPTFSLINEYEYPNGLIFHMDLYRLNSIEEALDIGIEGYLDSQEYCFIEWPTIIHPLLEDNTVHIHIETLNEESRMVTITTGNQAPIAKD